MPYRFEPVDGAGLKAAPGVTIAAGDLSFRLLDAAGQAVAGAAVEFHVAFGGCSFFDETVAEATTDANGVVQAPELTLGPELGPNGFLVQSTQATYEAVVLGTYANTTLALTAPPAGRHSTGEVVTLEARAVDGGYKNVGVPNLPVEVEILGGGATLWISSDLRGHYDLRRTAPDGRLRFDVVLGRRGPEQVEVRVAPYWERQIAAQTVTLASDVLHVVSYSGGSLTESPVGSVTEPLRSSVSRTAALPGTAAVTGVTGFAEDVNDVCNVHPTETMLQWETHTFALWPTLQGDYDVKLRLPDFPDAVEFHTRGHVDDSLEGPVPQVSSPQGGTNYVQATLGGNDDPSHQLAVQFAGAGVRYLGPNAVAAEPFRFEVTVAPPTGTRHLIEARFKAKVRLTPSNSSFDDPTSTDVAGSVGRSAAGPWLDEIELKLPGSAGTTQLEVHLRSNETNLDSLVELTANVTMEDVDASGVPYQFDEDAAILLRAAALRPRVTLARFDGTDFVPIDGEGVRAVTLLDRAGIQTTPAPEDAFYVEVRCHELTGTGGAFACTVFGGDQVEVPLQAAGTTPEYALYRSPPCFAYLADPAGPSVTGTSGGAYLIRARADGTISAGIDEKLPGNTKQPPVFYSTGRRPYSRLTLVSTGDGDGADLPQGPLLRVDVADDLTWAADVSGTDVRVEVKGTVRDALAELGAAPPQTVEINGVPLALTAGSELASFGRAAGYIGTFTHKVVIPLGVSLVTVAVTNALGLRRERRFRLEVVEATNNVKAPATVKASVRPLPAADRPRLPYLQYLYASGTYLGQGVPVPQSFAATVAALDAAPAVSAPATLPRTMTNRPGTEASEYACEAFHEIRADRIPAGATVPAGLLAVPPGGRVEWSTGELPNALGPISLTDRRPRPAQAMRLLRRNAAGSWAPAQVVVPGDVLRVEAHVFPEQPGSTEGYLAFRDPIGLGVGGKERTLRVELDQAGPGLWRLARVQSSPTAPILAATEIVVRVDGEEAPTGTASLRIVGSGRVHVGASFGEDTADVDVPAFVRPERHDRGGRPLDQEGLRPGIARVGALASVVAGTGEVVLTAHDRHVGGRNLAAAFERTYRSGNRYAGPLGFGWNASWNVFLWREGDGEVRLLQGDGHIVAFTRSGGEWQPPPGMYGKLDERPGWYRLLLPAGVVLTFLPVAGGTQRVYMLAAFEDVYGNRLRYTYPAHGRLAALTDTLARTFQLRHDRPVGRLKVLGDFTGCEVEYGVYGDNDADGAPGNLKSVRSPIVTNADNPFPNGRTESYGYEAAASQHRVAWVQDARGNDEQLGKLVEIDYHADGHVRTQKWGDGSFTFTPAGNRLAWTDRKSNKRRAEFDAAGQAGFAQRPARMIATVGAKELTHAYEYNVHGEITKHTRPRGGATVVTFDDQAADPRDRGNLKETKALPDGHRPTEVTRTTGLATLDTPPVVATLTELVEKTTHVPGLQLVETITDAAARVTTNTYTDWFLTQQTYPTVKAGGLQGAAQPRARKLSWNRWGQVLKETDPNGVVTRHWYYPASDPTGSGGSQPVSAVDAPGGYLAKLELDVADPQAARTPGLAAVRTITESFRYDDRGNVVEHVNGRNYSTIYEFNELDELIRLVGPELEETRHRYDANGRVEETLQTVADLDFPGDVKTQPQRTVRDVHRFDRLGQLVLSTVDADALSLTTRLQYDANGNLEYEHSPLTIAPKGTQVANRIRYVYDSGDRRVKEIHGEGSQRTVVREYRFDDDSEVEREIYGGLWGRWIDRDGFGREIGAHDDVGSVYETHLDELGHVARVVARGSWDGDPAHVAVLQEAFHYRDEAGRVVGVRERAFFHEPRPATTPGYVEQPIDNGRRYRRFAYDAAGHQVRSVDPRGTTITITVDGHGLPTVVDDGVGSKTTTTYNALHHPTTIECEDQLGTSTIEREYDVTGRAVTEKADGVVRQQVYYDTLGRPRLHEDAMGNRVEARYDGAGRVVRKITFVYDKGRRFNDDGTFNRLRYRNHERTVYNDNGNVVAAYDAEDRLIEKFEYDSCNLVSERTTADDRFTAPGDKRNDNPGAETYKYTYRKDGLIRTVRDPSGREITNDYDNAGRVVKRTIAKGAATSLHGTTKERYTWDGLGRLLEARDDNGVAGKWSIVRQQFTSLGAVRVSRQEQDLVAPKHVDEVTAAFRQHGDRELLSYANGGRSVRTATNAAGATEWISEGTSGHSYATYGYAGRHFSHRVYPNGLTYGYGYNTHKQVQEIRTYRGTNFLDDASMLVGHRYVYNAVGLPVRDQDLVKDTVAQFYYDSLYRLSAQVGGFDAKDPASIPKSGSWTVYDDAGNATKTQAGPITDRLPDGSLVLVETSLSYSTFNAANEQGTKLSIERQPGKKPTVRDEKFHYDRRGNLIEDDRNEYFYDYRNRLVEVAPKSGAAPVRSYYDAFGRRIRRGGFRYVWWDYDLLEERAESGSYKRFVYGAQPGELIAYETKHGGQDAVFYVHESRNGSVDFLTDSNGAVVERYGYDAAGAPDVLDADEKPKPKADWTRFPMRIHGHYYDEEAGIYIVGPRAYHPFLGRFMQRDPDGALADPLARGNAYTFAGNNPAAFTDETGSSSTVAAGVGAAAITAGKGLGAIGAIALLSVMGPIGVTLAVLLTIGMFVLFVYSTYEAASTRADEWNFTGAKSGPLVFTGAVIGDVFGISGLYEAYTGRRIGSGLPVVATPQEKAALWGNLAGQLVTLGLGARFFRGVQKWGLRMRGGAVETQLLINPKSDTKGAHLRIRLIDRKALSITHLDRVFTTWQKLPDWLPIRKGSVARAVFKFESLEALEEGIAGDSRTYRVAASYASPRAVVEAMEARYSGPARNRGTIETSVTKFYNHDLYVDYLRTCQTLPGELGLGVYVPVVWPGWVAAINGWYMGAQAGLATSAGWAVSKHL